jgi:hypothetical protein
MPQGTVMSEPASTAGAAFAGHKALLIGLPIAVTLAAWWLGLRLVPVRKGREAKDMLDRFLACGASSFVVGLPALLALRRHASWVFAEAAQLSDLLMVDPMAGYFAVVGCVLLLCSLPGPWIIAAWLRWFTKRDKKDIGEMLGDAADDVRRMKG